MCLHYAKSVYTLKYPIFNAPGAALQNESQCAVEYRPLIIGGSKSNPKEFPHMVSNGNIFYCSDLYTLCSIRLFNFIFELSRNLYYVQNYLLLHET